MAAKVESEFAGEENYLRAVLKDLPNYIPGKKAPEGAYKVSSNESPFEPVGKIQEALREHLSTLNRYPDLAAVELRAALARKHLVEVHNIHVSTGASAVLNDLVRACVEMRDEVIYPWRSFEAYPIIIGAHGGKAVPVALKNDGTHDLDAMLAAITANTRLILLCSPNNPTGTIIKHEELANFLAQVPRQVSVGLDEAYIEFNQDPQAANYAELFKSFKNLAIIRTFSKVHSLAGLRLGYAIAHPRLREAMSKVSLPFGASTFAQVAALTALEEEVDEELKRRVEWIVNEREALMAKLQGLAAIANGKLAIPKSEANFIYLPLGAQTSNFVDYAFTKGLIIRGYADGARITIAEKEANLRTFEVIKGWLED